jgi:ABC-type histidine transport system ATPase subunit
LLRSEARSRRAAWTGRGSSRRGRFVATALPQGRWHHVAPLGAELLPLAMNPSVMLCDEVTSAFDPELVGEVLSVIEQLAREGMTMIVVTHEVAFAHEVADLVAFMSDGIVVESGPPAQLLEHPENRRTRGFLARFHRFLGDPRRRRTGIDV